MRKRQGSVPLKKMLLLNSRRKPKKRRSVLHMHYHLKKKRETPRERFRRIVKQESLEIKKRGDKLKLNPITFINKVEDIIPVLPERNLLKKILKEEQNLNYSKGDLDQRNCYVFSAFTKSGKRNALHNFVFVGKEASDAEIRNAVRIMLDESYKQIHYNKVLEAVFEKVEGYREFRRFMSKHYKRASYRDLWYISSPKEWRELSKKFDRMVKQDATDARRRRKE